MAYKDPEKNKAYAKAYYAAHREEAKAYAKAYRLAHQDERRAYRLAHRDERQAYNKAWAAAHPDEIRAASEAWRQANSEQEKARKAAWQKANPKKKRACCARRRARKLGASGYGYTTSEHIAARWAFYGDLCYICDAPAEATDHVIPLARGGSHWSSNLRPICTSCNSKKGARAPLAALGEMSNITMGV